MLKIQNTTYAFARWVSDVGGGQSRSPRKDLHALFERVNGIICTDDNCLEAGSGVYVLPAELLLGFLHIYAILGQQTLTSPLFVAGTVDAYRLLDNQTERYPAQHTPTLAQLFQRLVQRSPALLAHVLFAGDLVLVIFLDAVAAQAASVLEGGHGDAEAGTSAQQDGEASPCGGQST